MSSWKKITSTFVLSMSAALLGAACVAQTEEATGSQDPTEQAEVTEAADSEISIAQPFPDWGRRYQCERYCRQEFQECRHDYGWDRDPDWDHGRGRHCRYRFERCLDSCRYR
jgi:hypothetical protein